MDEALSAVPADGGAHDGTSEANQGLPALRASAVTRYGARWLWNTPKDIDVGVLVERLRTYGDLAACQMADEIEAAAARESRLRDGHSG